MKANSSFQNNNATKLKPNDASKSNTREQRKKKRTDKSENDDAQMQKLSFNL